MLKARIIIVDKENNVSTKQCYYFDGSPRFRISMSGSVFRPQQHRWFTSDTSELQDDVIDKFFAFKEDAQAAEGFGLLATESKFQIAHSAQVHQLYLYRKPYSQAIVRVRR